MLTDESGFYCLKKKCAITMNGTLGKMLMKNLQILSKSIEGQTVVLNLGVVLQGVVD